MENPSAATTETLETQPDGDGLDTPGAESAPAAQAAGEQEQPVDRSKPQGQDRIDELTRNWRETQGDRDYWRDRALRLEQEREAVTQKREPEDARQAPYSDEELKTLADFNYDERAYGKYMRDVAGKVAENIARREAERVREEIRKGRTAEEFQQRRQQFGERVQAWAREQKVDDVDRMFAHPRDGGPVVTNEMAETIIDSDQGAAILNYLARNVAESKRIAVLSPLQQAREIGRIEAKLAQGPQPRTVSGAPPPPPRVDGSGANGGVGHVKADSPESDKLSDSEWMRAREKQIAGRRLAARTNRS